MADEAVLEVVMKMREEGADAMRDIKSQLSDIRDALKDVQTQSNSTRDSMSDLSVTAEKMAASLASIDASGKETVNILGDIRDSLKDLQTQARATNDQLRDIINIAVDMSVSLEAIRIGVDMTVNQLEKLNDQMSKLRDQAKDTNATLERMAITLTVIEGALLAQTAATNRAMSAVNGATTAQTASNGANLAAIPILGGLIGFLSTAAVVVGVVAGAFLLFGPILLQIIGYIVITTAYLLGLVTILATFIAGLAAGAIVLGIAAGALGGMAAAVVYLTDRLFTTGKILTDPLLGLENNLNRMADAWGYKAAPMAAQIISWLNSLIPLVTQAGNALLNWFGPHLPDLFKIANVAVSDFTAALQRLWNIIAPLVNSMIQSAPIWEKLFNLILQLATGAVGWLIQKLADLAQWFTIVLPIILPIVTGIFEGVGRAVTGLSYNVGELVAWFTWRLPAMRPIAESTLSGIGSAVKDLGKVLGNLVDWFLVHWPEITKDANDLYKAFKDGWTATAPSVKDFNTQMQMLEFTIDQLTHHGSLLHDVLYALGFVLGLLIGFLLAALDLIGLLVIAVNYVDTAFHNWQVGAKAVSDALEGIDKAISSLLSSGLGQWIANITGGLQGLLATLRAAQNAPQPGGAGSGVGGSAEGPTASMASGGTVPGPTGQAQLAIVHGGEVVLSNDRQNDIVNLLTSIDSKLSGALFPTNAYGRV